MIYYVLCVVRDKGTAVCQRCKLHPVNTNNNNNSNTQQQQLKFPILSCSSFVLDNTTGCSLSVSRVNNNIDYPVVLASRWKNPVASVRKNIRKQSGELRQLVDSTAARRLFFQD